FGEPTLTLGQTLWLLSPELVLLLAGLLVMALDAIRPRREEKRWLPFVALGGLALALIATITLWGCDTRLLYVLRCDAFALVVKAVALVATAFVMLMSDVYIRSRSRFQGEFYAILLFAVLAVCLLGGATNLVMVFLAFDFVSIASYILTGYLRDDRRSAEAAVKYFLYGAALSAVMLYGMSWFYGLTGSTDLQEISRRLMEMGGSVRPIVLPALILTVAGFAFKIAAVPFHQWAPDAYEGAPTPVTAFLSVGPKIAGFAVILRVLMTALPLGLVDLATDWRTLLMAISAVTMTVGNLTALWQENIKRMLAYSSIAQAGYILIGVVAASPRGTTAVLLYLAAYALTNLGAFAAVIAFFNQTGSDAIEDYAGLSQRAPGVAVVLIICLLSLTGIPPTAGFVGKLWLFSAAIEQGLVWLAAVGVINSVISLSYYWKVIRAMYLVPAQTEERLTTSSTLAVALGVTVAGVLIVGAFPGPLVLLIQAAAPSLFGG
ncbi:MAG: NADH-quinone oxidoreductase subunit N, partial [Anaerolineae bacterium]